MLGQIENDYGNFNQSHRKIYPLLMQVGGSPGYGFIRLKTDFCLPIITEIQLNQRLPLNSCRPTKILELSNHF